jgi:hypothetical protein
MAELNSKISQDMFKMMSDYNVGNSPKELIEVLSERLKFVTGEIKKDPKLGTGEYLKPPPGYDPKDPFGMNNIGGKGGTFGNVNMFGPAGGFGAPAGGPGGGTGGAPAVKVPNNYIVDTASMVAAINSFAGTTNANMATITKNQATALTLFDTGHQNNLTKLNDEMIKLNTISTNGYTQMLRRTDVTNMLLDTLIGATADAAAKPINISGKRVNDVMTNVKNRTYGITGA